MRTQLHFTRVNIIEVMYERSHVNVKVEARSTLIGEGQKGSMSRGMACGMGCGITTNGKWRKQIN